MQWLIFTVPSQIFLEYYQSLSPYSYKMKPQLNEYKNGNSPANDKKSENNYNN